MIARLRAYAHWMKHQDKKLMNGTRSHDFGSGETRSYPLPGILFIAAVACTSFVRAGIHRRWREYSGLDELRLGHPE